MGTDDDDLYQTLYDNELFVVFVFLGLLAVIVGLICSSYFCYPCRYRCIEICVPEQYVANIRNIEAVGMVVASVGVSILLVASFLLDNVFVALFAIILSFCWCFGIYMFYKEGQTYAKMPTETKVQASLGYQVFYDPPFPSSQEDTAALLGRAV